MDTRRAEPTGIEPGPDAPAGMPRVRWELGWIPLVIMAAAAAYRAVAGLERGEGASSTVLFVSGVCVACLVIVALDLVRQSTR